MKKYFKKLKETSKKIVEKVLIRSVTVSGFKIHHHPACT